MNIIYLFEGAFNLWRRRLRGVYAQARELGYTGVFLGADGWANIVGGDEDMATPNGTKDFNNIQGVPVVLLNTGVDGHEGSYYETHGGKYAQAVIKWLDWQMKGKVANAAFFLDEAVLNLTCPGWTTINKNFQ